MEPLGIADPVVCGGGREKVSPPAPVDCFGASSGAAALMPRTASPVVILAPTFDIVPFLSLFPPYVMYIIRPGYPRPQMGIKGNGVEF